MPQGRLASSSQLTGPQFPVGGNGVDFHGVVSRGAPGAQSGPPMGDEVEAVVSAGTGPAPTADEAAG